MSYGWLGKFRQGSWRSFRRYILSERRDVGKRIAVINAELRRIGKVIVAYNREEDPDTNEVTVTEERVGFSVTPRSSLEKLVQAYVALGGNPLDISHFFIADRAQVTGTAEDGSPVLGDQYPYGGLVYPVTAEYDEPQNQFGKYTGGFAAIRKYPPARMSGRQTVDDDAEPYRQYIRYMRRGFEKEIQEKKNDLEARILKLCDLREQLMVERDEVLVQAFGGLSVEIGARFRETQFNPDLTVPKIANLIDSIFYPEADDGHRDHNLINNEELDDKLTLYEDKLPDESNTAL